MSIALESRMHYIVSVDGIESKWCLIPIGIKPISINQYEIRSAPRANRTGPPPQRFSSIAYYLAGFRTPGGPAQRLAPNDIKTINHIIQTCKNQ